MEGRAALNCSDQTAAEIDAEVVEILKESYDKALSLLRENRELMDKLAEFLIEKETITGKEFMEIFRREKGLPEPEEKKSGEEDEKSVKEEQKQPKRSRRLLLRKTAGNLSSGAVCGGRRAGACGGHKTAGDR